MNYLSPQFFVKSTSDEGHIEGYASVFNVVDEQGDTVVKGAFKKCIERMKEKSKTPKFLWQHDARKPIGVWDEMYEDDYGLFVKGRLLLDLKRGREVWSMLKNKAVDGLSIGYKSAKRTDNNLITDVDLMEISVVTFPACTDAKVESVKSDTEAVKNDDTQNEASDTDKQIDAFAEIVKSVSKLTQTIYTLLK